MFIPETAVHFVKMTTLLFLNWLFLLVLKSFHGNKDDFSLFERLFKDLLDKLKIALAITPLNIKNYNLDNPSNDELPAFLTAGSEQYMKIMLAIFPPLELIEHSLGERPKTLCTDEASRVKKFSVRIYNLCFRFEPVIAARTRDGIHVGCTVHFTSQGCHGVGPLCSVSLDHLVGRVG